MYIKANHTEWKLLQSTAFNMGAMPRVATARSTPPIASRIAFPSTCRGDAQKTEVVMRNAQQPATRRLCVFGKISMTVLLGICYGVA